jgi:hypothetical protein
MYGMLCISFLNFLKILVANSHNYFYVKDEVRILKKQKMDLELRLKDQEEELDDLAGQVRGHSVHGTWS